MTNPKKPIRVQSQKYVPQNKFTLVCRKPLTNKDLFQGTRWQGLSIPELAQIIQSSYVSMLRTRLLLEYGDFLPEGSVLKAQHSAEYNRTISQRLDWSMLLQELKQEKAEAAEWCFLAVWIAPNKHRRYQPRVPILDAFRLIRKNLSPVGSELPRPGTEFLETEIEAYVARDDGRKGDSLMSFLEHCMWVYVAKQLFNDLDCLWFSFWGDERRDLEKAIRSFWKVYFVSFEELRDGYGRDYVYDLTDYGKKVEDEYWRRT